MKSIKPLVVLVRDPRQSIGGFESWVETLATRLPACGVDVSVFVPERASNAHQWKAKLSPARVQLIEAFDDPTSQAQSILGALNALARQGLAGVFFSLSYPYINVAGINLNGSPWLPIPVMHGRHPSAFDWMTSGPPRKVIVPSEDFAEQCRAELRMRIGRLRTIGRVVTIPHGVRVPDLRLLDEKRKMNGLGKLRLAAVSRLNEDVKKPWDYLHIAKELVRRKVAFELAIIGDGPSLPAMKLYASSHGLDKWISFAGAVDHSEIYSLLLRADVLISTSESEAFGLSVAEALACGCAVVSSDIPGVIPQMVTTYTGFRVPVGDIGAYADRIELISQNRELLRSMGRAGHELVREKFSQHLMLQSYARLIRKLCRTIRPNQSWTPNERLFLTPGEAVGSGMMTRFGVPRGMRRRIRSVLKGI